jgi:5'(3')-deoxyribonucleotidase
MKKTPNLLDLYEAIKPKYTIFCDMDGVLVDFDKGYKELTGKSTKHVKLQDKNEFWDLLKRSLKDKGLEEYDYWVNLPWMSDGQTLWDYIKQYNPYILTAPSMDPGSKQGKNEWIQRMDGMKRIYFKPARFKQELSGKNRILIDDRADTIDNWRSKGGIGILHTSAANTIKQLKDLGL